MDRSQRNAAAFTALLVPYLWLVQRYWFLCDDSYITFRFSRNLALGHGARYNLGDGVPVEGYSNFLWMLIAAGVELTGTDPGHVMPWLSAATGVATLALVFRVLLTHGGARLATATLATLAVGLLAPMAVWSTSGLATMPLTLGLFAAWAFLALDDRPQAATIAGIAGLSLALVRTEGIAWVIVVGVLSAGQRWFEGRPVLKPLLTYAAIVLVPYAVYFGWRASYYESWVSNTAKAKVHLQAATLGRGLEYLALYVTTLVTPALLLVAAPLSILGPRKGMAATASLLALGVPAYGVVVSGDYMTWFRLMVPGIPFMGVVFGLATEAVIARRPQHTRAALAALAAVAIVGHLPAHDLDLVPRSTRKAFHIRDKLGFFRTENQQWSSMAGHVESWRHKGLALAMYAKPDDTYVAAAIGALGYYSNIHIYDRNGLVSREVAEQPWSGELRSPGHDKVVDRSFFYDRKPTILDSKLVEGPRLKVKIAQQLRLMEPEEVRDLYYPEMIDYVDKAAPGPRMVLVALRRGTDPLDVAAGWDRWQATMKEFGS